MPQGIPKGFLSRKLSIASQRTVARRDAVRVSAHSVAADVPPDQLPPAHARAAIAAAKRKAKAQADAEESAAVLGRFLGLGPGGLAPAATVDLDRDQVLGVLEAVWRRGDATLEKALYGHAAAVTAKHCGGGVYYRGLVEFSNICQNDCSYCGIRNNQKDVYRYTMPEEEVVEVAKWALENGIRNVMLQSGELHTEKRLEYLEHVVRAIRKETVELDLARRAVAAGGEGSFATPRTNGTATANGTPNGSTGAATTNPEAEDELGVAVSLSVGELPYEHYERLFKAGARRYLIRIETSNPDLYAALHPPPLSWQHRVECLRALKRIGYMLGTGVMVGLPGQTLRDLAGDVVFFKEERADMIGMGPFITQDGTPATRSWTELYPQVDKNAHMKSMFELTTAMNALVRITLGNVNISATTAMQAIIPTGREIALERGANVVMPILTPTKYREDYQLYEGKPCITDTAVQCRRCLDMRLASVGKASAAGVWGDPASYLHQITGVRVPHDNSSPVLAAAAEADDIEQGATPRSPLPLRRLVEVPEDHDTRVMRPHGNTGKKSAKNRQERSHDHDHDHDHDDHDHDHHRHDQDQDHAVAAAASNASSSSSSSSSSKAVAAATSASWSSPQPSVATGRVRASSLYPRRGRAARVAANAATGAAASAAPAPGSSSSSSSPAGGSISSTTAAGVPRINIGVFGIMNAGKSSLVNALAQQEACIVDSHPGTTADVKTVLLELHDLGPAKLLDTAGLDEEGVLGDKKRRKALNCLKECDVAVVVVDTDNLERARSQPGCDPRTTLSWERKVMEQAAKYGVSPVLLLNVKPCVGGSGGGAPLTPSDSRVGELLAEAHAALDPDRKIPAMALDLAATPLHERSTRCAEFVKSGAQRSPRWGQPHPGCLPRWALGRGAMLLLVIPMDAETPGGRLLRPQAMVQEEAIRHWATVMCVRLDLDAARNKLGPEAREAERQRFGGVIRLLSENSCGPVLVVTDSQAVDVVHPWTLDPVSGRPLVPFTTFSICMAYAMSGGRLDAWVGGLEALEGLQEGDRVLISEACNHNRITKECNDIGMVQIPKKLDQMVGGKKLNIDHAYGREFPELESGQLGQYKLAIHCGACMIDSQKVSQRLADLTEADVPVTNYGMFFSYAAAPEALRRALEPWGLEPPRRSTSPATTGAKRVVAANGNGTGNGNGAKAAEGQPAVTGRN
ncbi:iron hydrogenase assembly protein [Volvox carteri f. nagariensis]|uniref:Iron hydrogenase assembly protein n=1 Tax=Volvox carteri f. nagariensis TaxID=3068 RepID=D8TQ83_VOLCA|nr:iron hydrogenase assembly protein [Volvox carteri f. nagariensis]EFJ50489.1 iron hydrogenase assembly protein [Volvox carteri f. nagariensis]|eukprot:XP_002948614.1 iron hydrogenase assembly protein [Volvox carteri f. nagariensis]